VIDLLGEARRDLIRRKDPEVVYRERRAKEIGCQVLARVAGHDGVGSLERTLVLSQFAHIPVAQGLLNLATHVVLGFVGVAKGLCYERRHEVVAVDDGAASVFGKLTYHGQRRTSKIREHHRANQHKRVVLVGH
jgi:hypothetical protein